MTDILAIRGNGDRPGADINEPLLASDSAALARAAAELDAGSPHDEVTVTCRYLPGIASGRMVSILDRRAGQLWEGKITAIEHSFAVSALPTTKLTLWRPL